MSERGEIKTSGVLVLLAAAVVFGFSGWMVVTWPPQSQGRAGPISVPSPTPSVAEPIAVAVIGDSYTAGQGASQAWPTVLDERREDLRIFADAVGGTGYVHVPERGFEPYGNRVDAAIGDRQPDLLLVVGSRNDSVEPASEVRASASSMYRDVQNRYPDTELLVVGPIWDHIEPDAGVIAADKAVRTAAASLDVTYVDGLRWFSGKPQMIGPDGVHPNDRGQQLLANRVGEVLDAHLDN